MSVLTDKNRARLRFKVEIGAGKSNVQLPNGFFYADGDVVELTPGEYELIPESAFESGVLVDLGPVTPVEVRDADYDVVEADES
jgi:hypothetical protein